MLRRTMLLRRVAGHRLRSNKALHRAGRARRRRRGMQRDGIGLQAARGGSMLSPFGVRGGDAVRWRRPRRHRAPFHGGEA